MILLTLERLQPGLLQRCGRGLPSTASDDPKQLRQLGLTCWHLTPYSMEARYKQEYDEEDDEEEQ